MAIPQQVQEAAEKAEALMKKAGGAEAAEVKDEVKEPPKVEEKVEAKAEAPPEEDWKKRYNTLRHSQDETRRKLASENQQMASELQSLRKRESDMQARLKELEEKAAEQPGPDILKTIKDSLNEETRDLLGDDAVEAIAKSTEAAINVRVSKRLDLLDKRIESLANETHEEKEKREHTEAKTAQEQYRNNFYRKMDDLNPRWRELDQNEQFLDWLMQPDEVSGRLRQDLLATAFRGGDVQRAADLYTTWETANQAPSPERNMSPASRGSPPPTSGNKKIWTNREIMNFYTDVTKGRYSEKKAAEIERDIKAAIMERRVTR